MTVKELIDELNKYDGELRVVVYDMDFENLDLQGMYIHVKDATLELDFY